MYTSMYTHIQSISMTLYIIRNYICSIYINVVVVYTKGFLYSTEEVATGGMCDIMSSSISSSNILLHIIYL